MTGLTLAEHTHWHLLERQKALEDQYIERSVQHDQLAKTNENARRLVQVKMGEIRNELTRIKGELEQ